MIGDGCALGDDAALATVGRTSDVPFLIDVAHMQVPLAAVVGLVMPWLLLKPYSKNHFLNFL